MSRWEPGAADIEQALKQRTLQAITGAAADGESLLIKAERTITTARDIAESDPDSAFVLAYDAVRQAGTALLAQQGLRPTTTGGHYVVERVLRAQFGAGMKMFGAMRRRRNELEYPDVPGDHVSEEELAEALSDAQRIIDATHKLLPTLGFFH
ncbi:MAG: HEPN domain-containing protein [Bifidobacteriaceae bacterium]|jgi:hypothetical protein|nr:HEPN domain-containing protein [Bifidobacteriaceae bacterium]